jgi:hypothetical protein
MNRTLFEEKAVEKKVSALLFIHFFVLKLHLIV